MKPRTSAIFSFIALLLSAADSFAGGSGLNVVVVVNQNNTNSIELGNYYCEKRQIPPQNVVRVSWASPNLISWDKTNFESVLLFPLQWAISARGLTNQIDFIVLSMGLPAAVSSTNGYNGTTAALYYGFKPDGCTMGCPGGLASCNLPAAATNAYAAQEDIYRDVAPGTSRTNFMVVMLVSDTLANAKLIVDHAAMSDGTFPTQTVLLVKSDDSNRNVRYQLFDDTIFNARLRGNYAMLRTNSITTISGTTTDLTSLTNLLGYENGLYKFIISPNTFVPGALADTLTSYGGAIFGGADHTTALAFLNAGAIGSYGTVIEPCNYLAKYPSSQNFFYQARGFNMAECYYQSVASPHQGLLLGEPLAAPFALPASGTWSNLTANSVLHGTTNLSLHFNAADATRPLDQVDFFLDGIWLQTLTNLPPRTFNTLYVTVNSATTNYVVPAGGGNTIKFVASNLTVTLNKTFFTNAAKVQAFNFGDRIELRSVNSNAIGSQISLSVSNSIGAASDLRTFVSASRTNFLDSIAWGIRSYLISGTVASNDFLRLTVTRTNGSMVTVSVTNFVTGASLTSLVQQWLDAINTNTSLTNVSGLIGEDLITYNAGAIVGFNLRARGAGFNAAQIQAAVSSVFSVPPVIQPAGTRRLDENLSDLQPRNHLYITSGATNITVTFPFNTTTRADGYHELTAVAYEGSHVQTQKRITQAVRIQNTPLTATFVSLLGDTNTAVEATLQFSVIANTNNSAISKIELFSTGGLLATINGQSNVVFSIAGTNLGVGLHPFYAIVIRTDGQQYRTGTKWIRIVAATPNFSLTLTNPPPVITWPAVAGRAYEILSATNVTDTFVWRDSITPTNSTAVWVETNTIPPRQFYRVRTSP